MDVVTYAHSPAIELRFRINWQEKRQILKLDLPTLLTKTRSIAKMPAETVERPADECEYPCHDWVALQGELDGKPAVVAMVNDSSYSYDAKDGHLRMILTRAAAHAEHPPFEYKDERNIPFLDQGWQERRFLLVAGESVESLGLDRIAQEFQIPAEHMLDSGHPGTEPWEQSLFAIEPESVQVLALKAAEDRSGTVIRLLESGGKPADTRLTYRGAIHRIQLAAHELATFKIGEGGAPQKLNGLER